MKSKFIAILITAVWSLTAQSKEITIGERKVIISQTLKEKREYWISLPTSFKEGGYDASMKIGKPLFSENVSDLV
ncbi:hypothetical protein ACJJI4_03240 [Microbulbifer sp. TRSA002]|uniref:hypothetical protein n=1 Tax=Microbulbifer sp. TRSA002 TaxID=3243382 RepID=UPI004039C2EC